MARRRRVEALHWPTSSYPYPLMLAEPIAPSGSRAGRPPAKAESRSDPPPNRRRRDKGQRARCKSACRAAADPAQRNQLPLGIAARAQASDVRILDRDLSFWRFGLRAPLHPPAVGAQIPCAPHLAERRVHWNTGVVEHTQGSGRCVTYCARKQQSAIQFATR